MARLNKRECYNKIPYYTKNEALDTIRHMRNRRNHRAYACHLTNKTHYHITSMHKGNYKQKLQNFQMHAKEYVS